MPFRPPFQALCLGLTLILTPAFAALPVPELIKDIVPGSAPGGGVTPWMLTAAGGQAFFLTNDGSHGDELWVSDGSPKGTRLVKDIRPGPASPDITSLTVSGDKVFFAANDGTHDRELWVSDGTEKGTSLVTDLVNAAGAGSTPVAVQAFGKGVVFVANADFHRMALWYTDGTENGTRLLKELTEEDAASPASLSPVWGGTNTHFYFSIQDSETSNSLWKTNGSLAGTALVKSFSGTPGHEPQVLGSVGSTVYLEAWTEATGWELWKTDGSPAGTEPVKDINPGAADSAPSRFAALGGKGYFTATTAAEGTELWVTDGTEAGTRIVMDAVFGAASPGYDQLAVLGDRVLISSHGVTSQTGLRAHDPVKTTTEWLQQTATPGIACDRVLHLTVTGSKAWYIAPFENVSAVWSTDGTAKGTKPAASVLPENGRAYVQDVCGLAVTGTRVFFGATGESGPIGLWISAGMRGTPIQGLGKKGAGSSPRHFFAASSGVFFAATTPAQGEELWFSNGTTGGTVLVKDIYPGSASGSPHAFAELNGIVYFAATTPQHGTELWRTDGTAKGTLLLKDIHTTSNSDPAGLIVWDDRIVFSATTQETGREVWITDGTAEGTQLFADIRPGQTGAGIGYDSDPELFQIEFGPHLLFVARTGANTVALFRSRWRLQAPVKMSEDYTRISKVIPGPIFNSDTSFYLQGRKTGLDQVYHCKSGAADVPVLDTGSATEVFLNNRNGNTLLYTAVSLHEPGKADLYLHTEGTSGPDRLLAENIRYLGYAWGWVVWQKTASGKWVLKRIAYDGETEVLLGESQNPFMEYAFLHDDDLGTLHFTRSTAPGQWQLWRTQGTRESTEQVAAVTNLAWNDFAFVTHVNRLFFSADEAIPGAGTGQEPYLLNLKQPQPLQISEGSVFNGYYSRPLADKPVVDAGPCLIGQSKTIRLEFANASLAAFSISLSLTGSDAFGPVPAELFVATGGGAALEIPFIPALLGKAEARLEITTRLDAEGAPPVLYTQTVILRGTGVDEAKGKPIILWTTDSLLISRESIFSLDAVYQSTEESLSLAWHRGTVKIAEEANTTLEFVTPHDAGNYTFTVSNRYGSTKSRPVTVAFMSQTPDVTGHEGLPMVLECRVTAPKEAKLTYRWQRAGTPLRDHDRVRGSHSPRLVINDAQTGDTGDYECLVTLATAMGEPMTRSAGSIHATVQERVTLSLQASEVTFYVGEQINHQLAAEMAQQITASARGLPPGITLSASGLFRGLPTRAGTYASTLSVKTAAGTAPHSLVWNIVPVLPPGNYDGLLGLVNEGSKGGRLQITMASTGTLSGKLRYEGKDYRLALTPVFKETLVSNGRHYVISEMTVPLGKGHPGLRMQIEESGGYAIIILTVGDGYIGEVEINPYRFSAQQPAGDYEGYYTVTLGNTEFYVADQGGSWGSGYLTATLGKTGTILWKGKLADGTAVTGSSQVLSMSGLLESPGFHLRQELYRGGGSFSSTATLSPPDSISTTPYFSGPFICRKSSLPETSKERNYKQGFYAMGLILGSQYQAPANGQPIFGTESGEVPARGTISGYETSETEGFSPFFRDQFFNLTAANQAILPALDETNFLKSLTLSPKLGTFKATVELTTPNESVPSRPWVRTATMEGVVLPSLNAPSPYGTGFFLLPELPAPGSPASALKTTPLNSFHFQFSPPQE